MLPPQLVSYGLQHISQSPDRFIRDSVARVRAPSPPPLRPAPTPSHPPLADLEPGRNRQQHLGSLLDYVSLAQDELIPSLGGPAPADPDPLPQLLGDLWGAAGLGAGDNAQVVHGRWPLLEQETLAVFRRVKKALGMAEGRPESAVAAQGAWVYALSAALSGLPTDLPPSCSPLPLQSRSCQRLLPRTRPS